MLKDKIKNKKSIEKKKQKTNFNQLTDPLQE